MNRNEYVAAIGTKTTAVLHHYRRIALGLRARVQSLRPAIMYEKASQI